MMHAEIHIRSAQTGKRCKTIKGGVAMKSEDNTEHEMKAAARIITGTQTASTAIKNCTKKRDAHARKNGNQSG